jgi:drug/metabolite transporter (DMT)-like permease
MTTSSTVSRLGIALCLAAGVAFAVQPVLGSIALDGGAEIVPMLGWRYALAAIVLALVARRSLRTLSPRVAVGALGLGLVLYTADSFLFYAALERTSAPFASLLHYAHLAVVVGAAALLGRERVDARRAAALVAILTGIAFVGGGAVSLDLVGMGLAIASAGVYAVYILASDRLLRGTDPIAYSSLLTTGAAIAFLGIGTVQGSLLALGGATGVSVVVLGALLGSAFALTAFLAGIRLVGPGTASLLVTVEVPVGLALAAVALGDRLAPPQLAGAALVVGAIVLLQVRVPTLRVTDAPLAAARRLQLRLARADAEPARLHTRRALELFGEPA